VERPFSYIRQDFFLGRSFRNLDDLNAQLDECHCPLRAVRIPRLSSAAASPRRSRAPDARSDSMIGRTFAAKVAASSTWTSRPRAATSAALLRCPSLTPCAPSVDTGSTWRLASAPLLQIDEPGAFRQLGQNNRDEASTLAVEVVLIPECRRSVRCGPHRDG
jgi:hypothetical protein